MATLFFRKACTVLLNAEERTAHGLEKFFFDVGRHDDVPQDIADKPYVQAHLGSDRDLQAAVPAANSPTTGTGGEAALTAMTAERDAALTARDEAVARAETRTIGDGVEIVSAAAGTYRITVTPEHQAEDGIVATASAELTRTSIFPLVTQPSYDAEIRITLLDGSVTTQAKGTIPVLASNYTPELV